MFYSYSMYIASPNSGFHPHKITSRIIVYTGASKPHQNLSWYIPYVYKCFGWFKCPRIYPGVWPASLSLYQVCGLRGENSHFGRNGGNLVKTCGKSWFPMCLCPNLTQPSKKVHWATPFRRTSMGVDENVRVFPADSGFRRSGAPERRNPTKT